MRKVIAGVFIGVMSIVLIGCGVTTNIINQKTQNARTDVFTEMKNNDSPAQGFVTLAIKATIKTPLEGYYLFESKDSMFGKPSYPFVINIDGQAAVWKVDGGKEILPSYDKDGMTSHDPEAGEGIKYVLEKKIQLRAGTHKVFLGLSNDDYFKELEIKLQEGKTFTLEFKPIYKYKTQPTRIPAFKKGIKGYEVYLNNMHI
ncbi:MAG: hypothetical protein ABSF13_12570 [Smithella sp.]|jgi:hypothetical protein